MKKFLSLLLVAVLVAAIFAVPVSADDEMYWAEGEYELVADNNVHPYHAWGYEFKIDSVNATEGACTAIFDNAESYVAKGPGKWTTQIVLAPVADEEGVYEVVASYKTTGKTAQQNLDDGTIDFKDGKIVLSVQDSGTRPSKKEDGSLEFPNWEDRAASWALLRAKGIKLTLDGDTLTVEDKERPESIDLLVSHVNAYNWGLYESMIIYGDEKTVVDVINQKPFWWIVYTVENIDGKYVATNYYKNSDECNTVKVPVGGFLYYVYSDNSAYAAADGGALLGYTFDLGEVKLEGVTAIDTDKEPAMGIKVYAHGAGEEQKPVEPVVHTNVALNKKYTISGIGNRDSYYGSVTDGNAVMNLEGDNNVNWFGFYQNGNYPTNAPDKVGNFVIDLEDEYDISAIKVGLIKNDDWGIGAPAGVKAYGSTDGEGFTEIGTFEYNLEDGVGVWTEIEATAKARFIKIEVTLGGTFAFVNEVEVYGGKGTQTPDVSTPDASTPDTSDKEDTEPGDASNMIIFAIIALVAIAGSAVVIKTRK